MSAENRPSASTSIEPPFPVGGRDHDSDSSQLEGGSPDGSATRPVTVRCSSPAAIPATASSARTGPGSGSTSSSTLSSDRPTESLATIRTLCVRCRPSVQPGMRRSRLRREPHRRPVRCRPWPTRGFLRDRPPLRAPRITGMRSLMSPGLVMESSRGSAPPSAAFNRNTRARRVDALPEAALIRLIDDHRIRPGIRPIPGGITSLDGKSVGLP